MTYQEDFTLRTELLEQLTEQGLEGLPEMIRVLVNEAMRLEKQNHLRVKLYERTEGRRGYANGYKPKRVKTRVGEINFDVPQVREGGFYPGALEKGLRSERCWVECHGNDVNFTCSRMLSIMFLADRCVRRWRKTFA